MISLDKKILDPNSQAAERMVEYGRVEDLYILIPGEKEPMVELSDQVSVYSIGGGRVKKFFRLIEKGLKLVDQKGIGFVTTQDPFFTGLVGCRLKKKKNIRLEVQLHGDFFSRYYLKENILRYLLAGYVVKKADKLRVVSRRVEQSLIKLGIDREKIELKPIKIDIDKIKNHVPAFNLKDKYPGYEKTFVFLGRLEPVKNIPWLFRILKNIRDQKKYLLLVIGDGGQRKNLENCAKRNKVQDNVRFLGWVDNPVDYLKTADALLFPSFSEGYGMAAMEAHAAGCKVIMSDVGVAGYELPASDRVKILPQGDFLWWLKEMMEV